MSRKLSAYFPDAINLMLGDAIWVAMVFVLVAIALKKSLTGKIAFTSLLFCYAIEITQLYHAPWINSIRATTLGGLALGYGFLWSDLAAYTIGVSVAALMEKLSITLCTKPTSNNPC
ncbi:MAG: DUF2809 domain-containing protein [Bacteroidales bacterium]|nr:DUF2809 domain-containing protein [Bacteroidales bacterium]MBN2749377.1 DUF2809 domain-containing protein [Bacteroidales bacterium]